jgi:RNA recognition motif-containing protein
MKIKISNLPLWIDEIEIKRHFESFGELLLVILLFDSKGASTGIAELIFATEAAAFEALAMHGGEIHGSIIKVELIG